MQIETPRFIPSPPIREGLYDPSFERDACGVGFVADRSGRKTHATVSDALQLLRNLQHRGACGCDQDTGDGAGILLQLPDPFFRDAAAQTRRHAPRGRRVRRRLLLPADRRREAHRVPPGARSDRRRRRTNGSRVATGADGVGHDRLAGAVSPNRRWSNCSSVAARTRPTRTRSSGSCTSSAGGPSGGPRRRARRSTGFAITSCSARTVIYKGMLKPDQLEAYFPDLSHAGDGVGAGARPQPVQHEHVPAVGAGAAVPHARAQRRDQHAQRQRPLAEGAPGDDEGRRARRRPAPKCCRWTSTG